MPHILDGRTAPPDSASSGSTPDQAAHAFLKRLTKPARILAALSGGGDSTALVVALDRAIKTGNYPGMTLIAATVDHGLRAGSAAEADIAGKFSLGLAIPHFILPWMGDKPRTGLQARAREARYRLLGECALSERATLIVTGHNRDDAEETRLMAAARNPEASTTIAEAVLLARSVWVMRPFLRLNRAEIRSYLVDAGIRWSEDPSNDNSDFERVRIRKARLSTSPPIESVRRGEARREVAGRAGDWLSARATVFPGRAAMLDLEGFDPDEAGQRLGLLAMAAVIGGRTHRAGRDSAERLWAAFRTGGSFRLASQRVVFDRRKSQLFLTREARNLPVLQLAPGQAAIWDNRFHIENRTAEPAVIAPFVQDPAASPLTPDIEGSALPASVGRRALAASPGLTGAAKEAVLIRPMLAQFDLFLTADMLDLANILARLSGLELFPAPPFR